MVRDILTRSTGGGQSTALVTAQKTVYSRSFVPTLDVRSDMQLRLSKLFEAFIALSGMKVVHHSSREVRRVQ